VVVEHGEFRVRFDPGCKADTSQVQKCLASSEREGGTGESA
jgi:hypothetical protein